MNKIKYLLIAIVLFASFLRLYNLNKVPVSLFGDELDLGYQAYSILKTGEDYSGDKWPIHFHSLAEWRTPLYLYAAVPTVALFGITPYGVRLPAAIFGIATIPFFYLLVLELSKNEKVKEGNWKLGLLASLVLAISPWHLQYSRAGFEVTQMLFFLVVALYLFLRSLQKKGSLLWLSGVCFALMPWSYSTAKLFVPMFMSFMLIVYWRQIFKLPLKSLIIAAIATFIVAAPIAYSTFFGGGNQRFNYISVFSDPTIEPEIGTSRAEEAYYRGETGLGLTPNLTDRLYHNKFTLVGNIVANNLLMPFSSDFLFISGDPNPRQSIDGMGELYRIEFIFLLCGIAYFALPGDIKKKMLLIGWFGLGVIPAALTRDGGNHATRLILLLLPLMFLVSFGICFILQKIKPRYLILAILTIVGAYTLSFISYQNVYWVHNPYQSERWWHYGWQDAIQGAMAISNQYDKVIITSSDEPPWIFFAGWSMYDPVKWHQGYPLKEVEIPHFGKIAYIDKYYFGSPNDKSGVYDWGKFLDNKTLYVASAKEVNVNFIMEPNRVPSNLKLIKAIAYPSGEPAFYLFTGVAAPSKDSV